MTLYNCLDEITDQSQSPELTQVFPFQVGSVRYTPDGLRAINNLLRIGYSRQGYGIGTLYNPRSYIIINGRRHDVASYRQPTGMDHVTGLQRRPEIEAGFNSFGGDVRTAEIRRGLLLHECIHAIQDNRNLRNLSVYMAEAAAYIAQCLFLRARSNLEHEDIRGICGDEVWGATEQIQNTSTNRTATDIESVLDAIRDDPLYSRSSGPGNFNGGIPLPPDEQQQQQRPPSSRGSGCSASGGLSHRSGFSLLSRLLGF